MVHPLKHSKSLWNNAINWSWTSSRSPSCGRQVTLDYPRWFCRVKAVHPGWGAHVSPIHVTWMQPGDARGLKTRAGVRSDAQTSSRQASGHEVTRIVAKRESHHHLSGRLNASGRFRVGEAMRCRVVNGARNPNSTHQKEGRRH
jgi:hypothetical protein